MAERLAKKVLMIGWDAADWKLIRPLLAEGKMPNLQRFMDQGVWGNITTLRPILSPMLWTSIATGKRPSKHGIHGFIEPNPDQEAGGGVRPVTSTSRRCKAIWNILTQEGFKTHALGYFASHPAEPINGVCVSNMFQRAPSDPSKPWPVRPGTIHPERLNDTLKKFRIHRGNLTGADLLPFIPKAADSPPAEDKRIAMLGKLLAECATVHAAATWVMEHEPWDFMSVYYDSVDHFSHGFMPYHPPRMERVKPEDFELYKDVVSGCYRFHDMMLGRLLALAGEDATVMILSDHGFHSDHLRPLGTPKQPAGPAVWHRPHGVFLMKGPHIKKNERIYGANLLDIAPTLLTLFGLPVGADMDGKPLVQAFEDTVEPEQIMSWESVEGECGMHPPDRREDPIEAAEALKQLVELGYIDKPDEDKEKATQKAINEGKFNLASSHMDAAEYTQAVKLLKELHDENPDERRYKMLLARCHYTMGNLEECKQIFEPMIKDAEDSPTARLLMGAIALGEGRHQDALEYLTAGEDIDPRLPTVHMMLGQTYLSLRRWDEAEKSYRLAIDIDGDNPKAYDGLAGALLRQKRTQEAADAALTAVGLQHNLPSAHMRLGIALTTLDRPADAVKAFEVCLSTRPGSIRAHRWLARLYTQHLNDPEKANTHRQLAKQITDAIALQRAESKTARQAT